MLVARFKSNERPDCRAAVLQGERLIPKRLPIDPGNQPVRDLVRREPNMNARLEAEVLPEADRKFYLDATVEERARRRWLELKDRGEAVDYELVLASMQRRDDIDSHREISPLRAADDAVILDTTHLGIQAVVDCLLSLVEGRGCPQA